MQQFINHNIHASGFILDVEAILPTGRPAIRVRRSRETEMSSFYNACSETHYRFPFC